MVTYIVATIAPRGGSRLQKLISEYPSIPYLSESFNHTTTPPQKNDEAIEVVRPRPGMSEPQLHCPKVRATWKLM